MTGLLFMALLLAGLVAYSHQYFFPGEFKWIFIAALGGGVWIGWAFHLLRRRQIETDVLDRLLLALTGYAALSLLWSPDPRNGAVLLAYWLPLWAVFTAIKNGDSGQDGLIFSAVALAVMASLLHHQFFPMWWSGFHNENYVTEFMLFALPPVAGLMARFWQKMLWRAAGFLLLGAMGIYLLWQNPSKIEFFVLPVSACLVLFPVLLHRSRRVTLALAGVTFLFLGGLAWQQWGGQNGYGGSLLPRMGLYFGTLMMWLQHPLHGNGAGSFNYLYPDFQEAHLHYFPALGQSVSGKFTVAGAAHNDWLQFLSDFGLIGLALLGYAAWRIGRRLRQQATRDSGARIGLAGLAVVFATGLIGFPLQNPATALLAAIFAGLVARAAREPGTAHPLPVTASRGLTLFMLLGACGMGVAAWRMDAAQREYFLVSRYYKADPQRAFEHNLQANRLNPLDWRIRVQLYESLLHWNRATGTPPLAPDGYDRVYAITRSGGPQPLLLIGRLQYLLDTGRHQQKQAELRETLDYLKRHFPRNADVWVADTYYNVLVKNRHAALDALEKVRALPLTPAQQMQQSALESMLASLP